MKYYLIAGEASGDLHTSNLMRELKKHDPDARFRFFGGDLMLAQGGTLVKHYREMAFMGFTDVLANIRTIRRNMQLCKKDILQWNPDALILTDYAGFNLRIAEAVSKQDYQVFYYISPKVWAWKKSRIKKLKAFVSRLFVIFPFEVEYFRRNGLEVEYHGNPLTDAIALWKQERAQEPETAFTGNPDLPVVALLAGSRKGEIKHLLPEMLRATENTPGYRFIVAGAPGISPAYYQSFMDAHQAEIIFGQTYRLLSEAKAAVVTSGTATLETALFRVPQVVVFKTGKLTFAIGRLFVRIRFFSLVNLIAGKEVVKELLQKNLDQDIRKELKEILENTAYRQKMLEDYDKLIGTIGTEGASARVAARMVQILKSGKNKT